jgi:hypothetical protein
MLNGIAPTLDLVSRLTRVLSHAWSTEIVSQFAPSAEEGVGSEPSCEESPSETYDTFRNLPDGTSASGNRRICVGK